MIRCFLCFGLLLFFPINALIVESLDLESLKLEIAFVDQKSLFVFDVDETLITSKDPFFCSHNNLPANCLSIQSYFGDLDLFLDGHDILKGWKETWISRILAKMEWQLVDSQFPNLVYFQYYRVCSYD